MAREKASALLRTVGLIILIVTSCAMVQRFIPLSAAAGSSLSTSRSQRPSISAVSGLIGLDAIKAFLKQKWLSWRARVLVFSRRRVGFWSSAKQLMAVPWQQQVGLQGSKAKQARVCLRLFRRRGWRRAKWKTAFARNEQSNTSRSAAAGEAAKELALAVD